LHYGEGMRPLVLISNDDGIGSGHLHALADGVARVADVVVVAPERQRSAASHAITLHKPLRITEHAPGRFALSGTPVDCVYVGMLKLAPRPPTLVLSGMNDGYNLGTDVFYSGTVAAAVEGALRGCVSIALSLAPKAADVATAVDFATELVQGCLERPLEVGTVLNVNLPGTPARDYRWTVLGRRLYRDDVAEAKDPWGAAVLLGRGRRHRARADRELGLRSGGGRGHQRHADASSLDRARTGGRRAAGACRIPRRAGGSVIA
jgi:5'-nucleotidase